MKKPEDLFLGDGLLLACDTDGSVRISSAQDLYWISLDTQEALRKFLQEAEKYQETLTQKNVTTKVEQ
jgi:hypothetical protein